MTVAIFLKTAAAPAAGAAAVFNGKTVALILVVSFDTLYVLNWECHLGRLKLEPR